MPGRKLSELPQVKFAEEMIDNCFYVDNPYNALKCVKMSEIFNWIKEKAQKDEGLTVECIGDQIIFITGRKS